MMREKFFSGEDGGYYSIVAQDSFDLTWRKVEYFESQTGKSIDDVLTKDDYIEMFSFMRIRRATALYLNQSNVSIYLRYLIAHGVLPENQEEIMRSVDFNDLPLDTDLYGIRYHKNIIMLHDAIQEVMEISDVLDKTVLYLNACVLYLAWYGLTLDEIVNYEKEWVRPDGILIRGKLVEPPVEVLNVMLAYKRADGFERYNRSGNASFVKFMWSKYLIRTNRSDKLIPRQVMNSMASFNNLNDGWYGMKYSVAYQSGLFHRAYLKEINSSSFDIENDAELASRVFREDLSDKQKRLTRIKDYNMYKKLIG